MICSSLRCVEDKRSWLWAAFAALSAGFESGCDQETKSSTGNHALPHDDTNLVYNQIDVQYC